MRPLPLFVLVLALCAEISASGDDGWGFRLTTPRGEIADDGDDLVIAIPGGRAWGITSGLQRVPDEPASVVADLEVPPGRVREAFVRIAYYERVVGRPRQVEVADSVAVHPGAPATVRVWIDPPAGAVAYRVRVLGRLGPGASGPSGPRIVVHDLRREAPAASPAPPAVRRTRLISERGKAVGAARP